MYSDLSTAFDAVIQRLKEAENEKALLLKKMHLMSTHMKEKDDLLVKVCKREECSTIKLNRKVVRFEDMSKSWSAFWNHHLPMLVQKRISGQELYELYQQELLIAERSSSPPPIERKELQDDVPNLARQVVTLLNESNFLMNETALSDYLKSLGHSHFLKDEPKVKLDYNTMSKQIRLVEDTFYDTQVLDAVIEHTKGFNRHSFANHFEFVSADQQPLQKILESDNIINDDGLKEDHCMEKEPFAIMATEEVLSNKIKTMCQGVQAVPTIMTVESQTLSNPSFPNIENNTNFRGVYTLKTDNTSVDAKKLNSTRHRFSQTTYPSFAKSTQTQNNSHSHHIQRHDESYQGSKLSIIKQDGSIKGESPKLQSQSTQTRFQLVNSTEDDQSMIHSMDPSKDDNDTQVKLTLLTDDMDKSDDEEIDLMDGLTPLRSRHGSRSSSAVASPISSPLIIPPDTEDKLLAMSKSLVAAKREIVRRNVDIGNWQSLVRHLRQQLAAERNKHGKPSSHPIHVVDMSPITRSQLKSAPVSISTLKEKEHEQDPHAYSDFPDYENMEHIAYVASEFSTDFPHTSSFEAALPPLSTSPSSHAPPSTSTTAHHPLPPTPPKRKIRKKRGVSRTKTIYALRQAAIRRRHSDASASQRLKPSLEPTHASYNLPRPSYTSSRPRSRPRPLRRPSSRSHLRRSSTPSLLPRPPSAISISPIPPRSRSSLG